MKLPAFASLLLACSLAQAGADCMPVRVGYTDQERAPYYLGHGMLVPDPAGASVDLIRKAFGSVDCPVSFVRLPTLRLRPALESGLIDMVPIELRPGDQERFALPLAPDGSPDKRKAVRNVTVMLVRAGDGLRPDTDVPAYFRDRAVGATHGAPVVAQLRRAGLEVDDGALDVARNLDKLKLRRIDGLAMTLASEGDMDAYLLARHGSQFTRLAKPLGTSHVWLAASKGYYRANPERVAALWRWIESNGPAQLALYLKQYSEPPR